jgi:hypothetical protein
MTHKVEIILKSFPLKFNCGYRTLLDNSDLAFPAFHVNKLNFYHFEISIFSLRHHLSSCRCQCLALRIIPIS